MTDVNSNAMEHAFGQVVAAGTVAVCGTGRITERASWHSYAIVYLLEGNGWFESEATGKVNLSGGDAFLLWPDIPHRYGTECGQNWQEHWISFSGTSFDALMHSPLFTPDHAILHLPRKTWQRRFDEFLYPESENGSPERRILLACKFQQLLAEIACADAPRLPDWVRFVQEEMQQIPLGANYAAMAKVQGMSYETFRKQFRQLTGDSPAHYHTEQVMRRAVSMLYDGGPRLKEIAAELGFYDEFHFSKRFKEWFGVAPAGKRRLHRKT